MKLQWKTLILLSAIILTYNACNSYNSTSQPTSGALGFNSDGWRLWKKNARPNWRGEVFGTGYIASDPTVIFDGTQYRMYYTCLASADDPADVDGFTAGFCQVKSPDGVNWQFPSTTVDPFFKGVIFRGLAANWDTNVETASVVKNGSTYELYYSGYKTPTVPANDTRPPSALGLATSTDGDVFTRVGNPILNPTNKGKDADDMFSAFAFMYNGLLKLIYVGWCVEGTYANHDGLTCNQTPAIQLVGASRSNTGVWTKQAATVLAATTTPAWLEYGVAEPAVLVGPDGYTYLFMTGGLGDDEPRITGVARSLGAFGPWEINPEPILQPTGHGKFDSCGTFAPTVLLENNKVRMWYLGLDDCDGTCTSCNFLSCGCEGKFGIGYAEADWPLRSEP